MNPPVRVVFDTNVLISLFVFADSRLAPLWGEVVCGQWLALTNAACLAEFRRVLAYPLFSLPATAQAAACDSYLSHARIIAAVPQPARALPQCEDRDDQKFLELARDGGAQWLITADKALLKLRRGRRLDRLLAILTPEEALQKIGTGGTAPNGL